MEKLPRESLLEVTLVIAIVGGVILLAWVIDFVSGTEYLKDIRRTGASPYGTHDKASPSTTGL